MCIWAFERITWGNVSILACYQAVLAAFVAYFVESLRLMSTVSSVT